jgi:enamine deaminase RidA (YjgF/YER057c/UK114 family)
MPRQIITTANAPSSPLYSQGVKAGSHMLVSGIVGIDPSTGSLAGDTIEEQTRQALTNCEAIGTTGSLRRKARCRTARTARVDSDDRIHPLTPRRMPLPTVSPNAP